ncbi:glutamyl-tRNA reductase [Plasticicumulans lactativorans]|uniref:Glutamyl-tRNA reductase n=1 Tax=Plasticicumulans lactativorans TaxID=1133106 RepID=A0A4R2LE52_9GAMM|nr:glutamyl-tRNA reductase [Plasticicumulans lactativorans]TCO81148.1 glutamyl-tRNA reductase [Plasticicumulans lactativorans]
MPLLAIGINHKTAPVSMRERIAFAPDRLQQALRELVADGAAHEAAILSTCNRTEVYCGLAHGDHQDVLQWLSRYHAIPAAELSPFLYVHPEQDAVRHMLRVASGLDSMVLGEPQILGQVKDAYQTANAAGTLDTQLERLFQHTFAVAKQVRTDTSIGASPVSVAFAAVSLARQIFDRLDGRTALLLGAGETVELVARHLREQRIGRLVIANRTLERAHALAVEMQGYAIGLAEIDAHLAEADIVIAATASPEPLVLAEPVRQALKKRRHQPMLMVDIAVPRDIAPAVGELDDVYLYSVDDLQEIIRENLRSRQAAAEQAEEIIDTQVAHFMAWQRAQDAGHLIRALRRQAEAIRDELLAKGRTQLAQGRDPLQVLEQLAHQLTNKLLHAPSAGLREASAQGDADTVAMLSALYRLDETAPPRP